MKKNKVVCVGEALIDRIQHKSNQGFKDFLGGAPANVACALRKLNIDSIFIGRLGRDKSGKKFVRQFKELEVNVDFLQFDDKLSTRIVKVDRDQFGDRFFSGFVTCSSSIYADETLSKNLEDNELQNLQRLFLETKYLIIGTNILTAPMSSDTINFLLEIANKFDVNIVIDLNWREVFWDYSSFSKDISKNERINIIRNFLDYANVLKLAKEEAILFFQNEDPDIISKQMFRRPDVFITDGKNPVSWYVNGLQGTTSIPNSQKIVDTTGAGDSFLAGLISKFISSGYPSDKLNIEFYVRFASVCGLLTCLGEGAIEQQPDYEKVNKFLGSLIS